MSIVRLRVTGTAAGFEALMGAIEGLEDIEHVEEVGDLRPPMDDTSSLGLPDDEANSDAHALEIHTSARQVDEVKGTAERIGAEHGLVIEFVDEF